MKTKVISIVMCAIFVLSVSVSCTKNQNGLSAAELLDLGNKYLTELNYEQAIVQFTKLIEVEPKNPQGYIGAAKAYIALGENDKAVDILQKGIEATGDSEIEKMLRDIVRDKDITELPENIQLILNEICKAYISGDKELTLELQSSQKLLAFCKDLSDDGIIIRNGLVETIWLYCHKKDNSIYEIDIDYTDANVDGNQCSTLVGMNESGAEYGLWQQWINKNGVTNGLFEQWQYNYRNDTHSFEKTTGTAINGAYEGEVTVEFSYNGVAHKNIYTYKSGYVQQIGTWEENGTVIVAIDENDNPVGASKEILKQRRPFNE